MTVANHTFTTTADETLERVKEIYRQRGGEYSDSWGLENLTWRYMDAVLQVDPTKTNNIYPGQVDEWKRLLLLAALIDVKDSRMGGPWKRDSVEDGIAYRASFATLRDEYARKYGV